MDIFIYKVLTVVFLSLAGSIVANDSNSIIAWSITIIAFALGIYSVDRGNYKSYFHGYIDGQTDASLAFVKKINKE